MPIPAEPGQPQERKVVEPIRVLRPRNTDALADLFREMTELTKEPVSYESIPMQGLPGATDEAATEQLPPVGHWTDTVPAPDADGHRADGHDPAGPAPEPAVGQDWADAQPPYEPAADWDGPKAHGPAQGGDAAAPAGWGEHVHGHVHESAAGQDTAPRPGWGEHAFAPASSGPAERAPYGSRPGRPAGRPHGPPPGRTRAGRRPSGAYPAASAPRGARGRDDEGSGNGLRRAAITIGVCAAALVGFAGALLVPGRGGEAAAETVQPQPSATQPETTSPSADPDGAGTLREGDSGPEVTDLQQRLLKIPDVYRDGATDGQYNATLTEAVARFQLWYGIRGDEDGVYGDDTREALESRTGG
ncbi:peptidoglycan-binding protein [Streptomyces griseoruber]|uniref:peptidoglycan-binding protein n=1 Tax=Streptomyces griseoruber TaxID=1943 RepID=UPI0037AC141B